MWIRTADVQNFKSIENSGLLTLGRTTVIVGRNNSGKSSFIQALYSLQIGSQQSSDCVRAGASGYSVTLGVAEAESNPWNVDIAADSQVVLSVDTTRNKVDVTINGSNHVGPIAQQEPLALFYPQLGKRKVQAYQRDVNAGHARTIVPSWQNLVSRLQRLANPDFPGSDEYRSACEAILGFVVTVFPAENGQQAGRYLDRDRAIPLEQMGEGVSAVVGLLVDLASAEGKIFLIEEPENDLHPRALKQLLQLLLVASTKNQVIVTTHSNIVLKYLGSSEGAVIIRVSSDPKYLPPSSHFAVVDNSPESRLEVLRDLGYELFDVDGFDAWLILEESSAERLIRQHFVPWFAPALVGRLRTLSTQGTGNVEPTFTDFHRLFLYAHLQPQYRNRAWVVVDGDLSGAAVIQKLRDRYGATWSVDNFRTFSASDFERQYPVRFATQAQAALDLSKGRARREAKAALLNDVLDWISIDEGAAREEFEQSAPEVVALLKDIEAAVGVAS